MNDHKGLIGAITTTAGALVAWLPLINELVQITAGIVAIVVGIVTIRHYNRKDRHEIDRIHPR